MKTIRLSILTDFQIRDRGMPVLTALKRKKNTGEAIKRIRKIFLKFQQTAFMAVYFLIYIC